MPARQTSLAGGELLRALRRAINQERLYRGAEEVQKASSEALDTI
jgi:hypothetical protein